MPRRASGEGTIKKRILERPDGTSYVRWFARITIAWDGKKKESKDGPLRKTQAEAKADLTDLKQKQKKGLLTSRKQQRLSEYALAWLEQVAVNKKFRTYQSYEQDMRNHVLPRLGHKRIDQITKLDVQTMLIQIYSDALTAGRDGAAVTRKAKAVLRIALQDAVDLDLLEHNPCMNVKVPAEQIDEVELWTPQELHRFLEIAIQSRIYPIIYTALTTGMRQGELLALRWQDIETYPDTDTNETIGHINIRNTLVYVMKPHLEAARRNPQLRHLTGQFFFNDPKTKKSKGLVTIPADTVAVLEAHRAKQEDEKQRFHTYDDFQPGVCRHARHAHEPQESRQDLQGTHCRGRSA